MQREQEKLPVNEVYYQAGKLPKTNTDEWRKIADYCNVEDQEQFKSRKEEIFRYIFPVSADIGVRLHLHGSWLNFSKRFSGASRKRKLENCFALDLLSSAAATIQSEGHIQVPESHNHKLARAVDRSAKFHVNAAGDHCHGDNADKEESLYAAYFLGRREDLEKCKMTGEYLRCAKYRESQFRKRPGSLLKENLNGYLRRPVQNRDFVFAETETITVHSKAREEDFAQADTVTGFSIVNLCEPGDGSSDDLFRDRAQDGIGARAAWVRFRQNASAGDDQKVSTGGPLFLDHFDPANECKQHIGKVKPDNCETLAGDPAILIDETGMRFDPARVGLSAKEDTDLSATAAFVHQKLMSRMPPQFDEAAYNPSRTYREEHASALATMEKALRQGFHVDTHIEGFSALVAVESDFRVIVFKNSLALTRRVVELWNIYDKGGRHSPQGVDQGEWWDFCCWRQLQKEGWGQTRFLEPRTLIVPKGHALIFSTWLIHAGAEWDSEQGDFPGYNRIHFYLTPYLIDRLHSVRMHEQAPDPSLGPSFSPALHFYPLPVALGFAAPVLPKWFERAVQERKRTLRSEAPQIGRQATELPVTGIKQVSSRRARALPLPFRP